MLPFFAAIAKVAAAEAFTQADERSWYSLPKKVLVQKVKTPAKGYIQVSSTNGPKVLVKVDPTSHTNFVFLNRFLGKPYKSYQ